MTRIGSLCSGYGGLDMAVEAVTGGEVVWCADNARGPAIVQAARFGVPNLGDITRINWPAVVPVEILTAGYPCQPFSAAGRKKGTSDERHLWPYIREAIRHLRPRLVVLENVANHRRIGFGDVLGDLAAVGFDAEWTSLRASDVGAPHERQRVFIAAWRRGEAVPNATSQRRDPRTRLRADDAGEVGRLFPGDGFGDSHFRWDAYAPAIERWAAVVGRQPTRPVVKGPGGGLVPSPRFLEWLMGLPDGWVTAVQGLTAEEQIRLLGNGVVPQQAEAALRWLLAVSEAAA